MVFAILQLKQRCFVHACNANTHAKEMELGSHSAINILPALSLFVDAIMSKCACISQNGPGGSQISNRKMSKWFSEQTVIKIE